MMPILSLLWHCTGYVSATRSQAFTLTCCLSKLVMVYVGGGAVASAVLAIAHCPVLQAATITCFIQKVHRFINAFNFLSRYWLNVPPLTPTLNKCRYSLVPMGVYY